MALVLRRRSRPIEASGAPRLRWMELYDLASPGDILRKQDSKTRVRSSSVVLRRVEMWRELGARLVVVVVGCELREA